MRWINRTQRYWTLVLFLFLALLAQGCVGEIKETTVSDVGADTKPQDQTSDGTINPNDIVVDGRTDLDLTEDVTAPDVLPDVTPDVAPDIIPDVSPDVSPDGPEDMEIDVPPVPFCESNVQQITFEELTTIYPQEMCGFWARCGEPLPLMFGAKDLTIEECLASFPLLFNDAITQGIASNIIQYSPTSAANCLRSLCNLSCGDGDLQSTDCETVFVGSIQEGQVCYTEEECAPGTGCNACGGVCERQCNNCPANQFCDWNAATCVPLNKENDLCNGNSQSCEPHLYCKSLLENNNWVYRCLPRLPDSQACSYDDECGLDSFCNTAQTAGFCQAKGGNQAPCAGYNQCKDPLVCVMNAAGAGQCLTERRGLPDGMPCNPETDTCAWPNVCVPGTNGTLCGPRLAVGKSCTLPWQCQGYCDANQTCQDKLPVDSTCRNDYECELFCSPATQKCISAQQPNGQACDNDFHCLSGQCTYLPGNNNGQCVPPCTRP